MLRIAEDVPAKLSARTRLFDTTQGRKTDPADAHCIAIAALRAYGLRQVVVDDVTVVLKLLVDRRDELGRARTEALSRLHHLLLELVPGPRCGSAASATCWPPD
ncbi:transposase [Dactylosporangium sp. NPDC051484]|uniref:IS110 family transposase n=1 Tax=Dactylosporangium sp. NPDC051484 TaxID=3154942 RepID=UPI00344C9BE3